MYSKALKFNTVNDIRNMKKYFEIFVTCLPFIYIECTMLERVKKLLKITKALLKFMTIQITEHNCSVKSRSV